MKVEALMTCVGRSSFLGETLPANKEKFSNIIVVTTPSDYETQKVCADNEVTCIQTSIFYKGGATFNKGAALNEGLKHLTHNEWVVFTDCDIVFLNQHRFVFNDPKLNKECLYGTSRIVLETKKDYTNFVRDLAFNPDKIDLKKMSNPTPTELFVGFFQLIHTQSSIVKRIKSDVIHADDDSWNNIILPAVNGNKSYTRTLKASGELYPCFPTAGACDSLFRHFYYTEKALVNINIPVLHLGVIGKGHKGVSRNFE